MHQDQFLASDALAHIKPSTSSPCIRLNIKVLCSEKQDGLFMAETICRACGQTLSEASDSEQVVEEVIVTWDFREPISPDLDRFDRLHGNMQTGCDMYVDDPY
jgi:hypothetical protein